MRYPLLGLLLVVGLAAACSSPAAPQSDWKEWILQQEAAQDHLAAGKRHLFRLEPASAIGRLCRVVQSPAPDERSAGAALLVARACAELGNYRKALAWLRAYDDFPRICRMGLPEELHVLTTVWKAAAFPGEAAEKRLRRLAAGGLPPLRGSDGESQRWQKRGAAREASLVLGELLVKQGRREAGRSYLLKASRTGFPDVAARLAKAHLRRLAPVTHLGATSRTP